MTGSLQRKTKENPVESRNTLDMWALIKHEPLGSHREQKFSSYDSYTKEECYNSETDLWVKLLAGSY